MVQTRLFFATDIHGSEDCFLKFLNAPKFYKADVLILSGDLSGKLLVPIVSLRNGTFEADFLGVHRVLSYAKVGDLESQIRRTGSYPYRMDQETFTKLKADRGKLEDLFSSLMNERISHWVELADQKLKGSVAEVYISGGNDDQLSVDSLLRRSKVFKDPEGEVVKIHGGYEMITCGWSNPTPWQTPREASEEELREKLEGLVSDVQSISNCIFNIHVPPFDSGLDLCQKLDEELKPIFSGGQPIMFGSGSIVVRSLIERYQPLLGLHGHLHESRGVARIGRTLCLNPGSEYAEAILRGVIVDLEGNRVQSHLFTSG